MQVFPFVKTALLLLSAGNCTFKVEHSNCKFIANKTLTVSHHLMTAGKAEMKFPRTALLPCVIPSWLCW